MPQTSRSASHISPIVTYAREASTIAGMRFSVLARGVGLQAGEGGPGGGGGRGARAGTHALDLLVLEGLVDPEDLDLLLVGLVAVDPDDHPLPGLELALEPERGLGDLPLEEVLLMAETTPPSLRMRPKYSAASASRRLVRSSRSRSRRAGRSSRRPLSVREHLLGAERDLDRVLGREREGLVEGVRVQRLAAAQHRGERSPPCARC